MILRFVILVSLLLFAGTAAAGEIRSPVCPVGFGSSPCTINIANSPSLLSDYESIYLNVSNGYDITSNNFYYAAINYRNSQTDLFSTRYNVTSISSAEAILTKELYNNGNNLQVSKGKEIKLKDDYALELVDTGEYSAFFTLKKNNEILEKGAVERNKIFSYTVKIYGRDVEIFRTKLVGIFEDGAVIRYTILRDVRVIKNGESFGDYEIKLKDIDGDGYIDIVYSLKNKILDLPDDGTTPVLGNFVNIRTYPAYVPFYKSLETLNLTGTDTRYRIYSFGSDIKMPVSSFLGSPPDGSIIAAGIPAGINVKPNVTYKGSNSTIGELRGDHTFYIYTKGELNLTVTKQDLNWYNGSDALEIKIYSLANTFIKNITIPDDGNTGNNGSRGYLQSGALKAALAEGAYKVTMTGGGDLLIRNVDLNSGNMVVQNPFLAGILYTNATKFRLYTKAVKGDRLKFSTYHNEGRQIVNITSSSFKQSLNISAVSTPFYIDLPPGNELYQIEVPKGDVIINANGYFSFSNDTYFSTSSAKMLPLQNSMEWLKKNKVDYVIIPSSNPFTGLYFFKPKNDKEFYVRSPKTPWTDYTIDTWSAPNVFYFDPDKNNTWEYITINTSGGNSVNKKNLKYVSVQSAGDIGYRGGLYKVLHETSSELVLSEKLADSDNKTLFINKEWQVGGKYTLALRDVDTEGGTAIMELARSNKTLSRQIISKGSTMFYNSSFKGKEVIIFRGKLAEVFHGTTSLVKLKDIELYDEDSTIIKSGVSTGSETASLSDINGDGHLDITTTLNSDFRIDKSTRKTLFSSYLDMVVESNGYFYLERKVISPVEVTDNSNIVRNSGYTLAPYLPENHMMLTFSDSDITAISINASVPIDQVKINIKELKNKPEGIIIAPKNQLYKYFSISIGKENIKNATVYFKVNKSWINSKKIDNASIALVEFQDGVWETLPTYETGSDGMFAYYSAEVKTFSTLFAISGSISSKKASPSSQAPSASQQVLQDTKQRLLLEEYSQPDTAGQMLSGQAVNKDEPNKFNFSSILIIFSLVSIVFSGIYIHRRSDLLKSSKIALYLSKISFETFNSLLITFLLLLLIDNIWDKSVTDHVNLNYLMFVVLLFGIVSLYGDNSTNNVKSKATEKEYIIIAGLGVIGLVIIWSKVNYMGFISYPISIIGGVLIVLLSLLMLENEDTQN